MVSGILMLVVALQDPGAPVFKKFEFARERIEHKVDAEAVLSNPGKEELPAVSVTAIYYDLDKELRRSKTVRLGKIAAGASSAFRLVAEQVPNFTRYEVYVEAGGRTRVYNGNEAAPFPTLKSSEPAKLSVVSCSAEASAGTAKVTLVVRNAGEVAADEPTAVVSFLDTSGAATLRIHVRLERQVAGGGEDTYEVTVPRAPDFTSVQSGIAWGGAERMALIDAPPDSKQLVLTGVRIVRLTDGWARISGVVRNGQAMAVEKVVATFKLGKTDAPYSIQGALKSGQSFPFEFYVPDCPPFDDCTFGLAYSEAVPSAAAATAPSLASAKRTDSKKVEGKQAKLPDPVKPEKPQVDDKSGVKVELRGVMMVEGISFRQGQATKYTGDTFILKLVFTDEKGATFQPTPLMNFVVYNGQEPWKKVQRNITKEQWNGEASKINSKSVSDNTIACDKKANELWVAFVRSDGTGFDPRFDLTLEIKGAGTWIWKGMDKDKKWESAARGPDKPEKK
jgi:hypothetical protein